MFDLKGPISEVGAGLLIAVWIGGIVHPALLRTAIVRQLVVLDDPAMKRACRQASLARIASG